MGETSHSKPLSPPTHPTETNRWNSAGLVEVEGSTPVPPAKGPSLAAMAEVVAFRESAEQVISPVCKYRYQFNCGSLFLCPHAAPSPISISFVDALEK